LEKVPVIVNPISGQGIGLKALPYIEAGLLKLKLKPEILKTQKSGDAQQFAAQAADDTPYIIAVGGDGTLNEVLNGIMPRHIPLAIFPTGTGNVFAKEIGIKTEVDRFLNMLENGHVKKFDVGLADSRHFLSVCGAGFVSEVVRRMEKQRRGNMRMTQYVHPTVAALLKYDFPAIKVEIDGEIVCEDAMNVEVGNTASYGGPLKFTTLARPDDGLLDICIFRKRTRWNVLKALFGSVTGLYLHFREVMYFKGRRVSLTAGDTVPTHVDGDGNGTLPTSYGILPMAASILVPPETH